MAGAVFRAAWNERQQMTMSWRGDPVSREMRRWTMSNTILSESQRKSLCHLSIGWPFQLNSSGQHKTYIKACRLPVYNTGVRSSGGPHWLLKWDYNSLRTSSTVWCGSGAILRVCSRVCWMSRETDICGLMSCFSLERCCRLIMTGKSCHRRRHCLNTW